GPVCGLLVFGYSGWGPGQLEHEMEEGSWLVLPYDPAFAFPADVADLWERALAELGVRPECVSTPPGGVN
ncbi:MAG TPA: YqgE/AlgH family protein, partial [Thermoanaerobaculia bacterium]|nr:YqgE/AlgH family protein [Thermoanaerobaculia bacterium]